jgi:RNA polymerase sigma-70 factor (ECF subfamily)
MRLAQGEGNLPVMKIRKRDAPASETMTDDSRLMVFEQCFEQYWASIYGLLRRMIGDPAEAEDLALEAFFRLYRRREDAGQEFNTGGWLYRVATNLGLHSIRALKRRERYETSAGKRIIEEAPEDCPAEIVASEEQRHMAQRVLADMNPRQSQLLVMRYSGLAYKDIAAALNLSPTSIGPLLVRAEEEFERRYRAIAQEDL